MRKKRFLAVVMAASMMLGSSVSALASTYESTDKDGVTDQLTGRVSLEDVVDPEVFRVELPTVSTGYLATAFDFVMDPQGLIASTNGAAYKNNTSNALGVSTNIIADKGTLFFANTTSNNTVSQLSSSSNALTITNKGNMDVNVELTAEVVSLNGVTMVSSNTISDGAAPSVYLAVKDDNGETPIFGGKISVSASISGQDDAYVPSWNQTDGYIMSVNGTPDFEDYSFQLKGASGGNIKEWLKIKDDLKRGGATVNVVWTVKPDGVEVEDTFAPFATNTVTITQGSPANVEMTLPNDVTIAKIEFVHNGSTRTLATDQYSVTSTGSLRFKTECINVLFTNSITERTYTVTFSNGKTADVTLKQ